MEAKPAPPTINPLYLDIKKEEIKILDNIPLIISNDGNFLKFKATIPDDFFKKEYELVVSLEQLKEMNNYFKVFKDLNEVYYSLINEYKNRRISFTINESEIKIKILNIILSSEFEIFIPRIESLTNNSEIYNILLEMQKRIKYLESENKNLKNQVEENKSRINFLENYLKIYSSTPVIASISSDNSHFFKGSNIINNEKDINLLIDFFPKKPSNTLILFNSLIHGDTIQQFHSKIANKTPTLIIIKTQKDKIFGGYTAHIWNEKNNDIFKDINAFVFSLNNRKKYKIKNISNAIVERETHIQFGTCCFRITNNFTQKENLEEDCDYETNEYCLSGENNYIIKNLEVFLIEY